MVKPEQLRDFLHTARLKRRDAISLIVCSQGESPISVSEIVRLGKENGLDRIATWNVSQYLAVNRSLFIKLPSGWTLGPKGQHHVKGLISKITHGPTPVINETLRRLLPKLPNDDARAFVSEAISCYETQCYRAAVVLSWVGAVAVLHNHIIGKHLPSFNAEALARDSSWKPAKIADDLGLMKEDKFLDILVKISVLGKNEKELLKNHCLALRNACGHPNSVQPGEHTVAAHLEILINQVFTKF